MSALHELPDPVAERGLRRQALLMLAREGDRGLTVATRTGDSRDVNGGGIDLTIPLALFEEIERMAVLGLVEDLTHVSVSAYSRAEQIAFRLTPRGRGLVDNLEGR